ncbi:raffinose/stachyose/melibiose transport system substrate-binding protein [Curtobacterium pusillum]|uniref:Raffinose/stachyose/melibiose transport system substrate-binding protein n=1 Tax=Curtobacterium pusillum TaxID=69373 RepID=A0AAW3TAV3_9MICO|nr:extracellular solute-binding protein [Curtobacterium pusillum]MBA8992041.1 raffinose/stachyose/melibiose transport system substrate-binding protein [Curtobacterium pusillum]
MQPITRRRSLRIAAIAAIALSAAALTGCSASSSGSGKTFTIMQYEDKTTAQGQGWQLALDIFKKKHPDVNVKFQTTSFDGFRKNAKLVLGGNKVPDVVEFNKGNADGGQLASQGLLQPLDNAVKKYNWDDKITGSMQSFAKYDAQGKAGSGQWYGIPNVGEYVTFYYNKDKFKHAGIDAVPTTMSEFTADLQKLKDSGTTPISSSAAVNQGFNQMWIWYSLVSAHADRKQIDNFMFLKGKVDFNKDPWKSGTQEFQDWIDKGYVGKDLGGLNYEQAIVNFLSGKTGMLIWNNGAFARTKDQASFGWGSFTLPGANMSMGSSGHLWGVPAKAKNKDLAYDWINTTLSAKVQNKIGELGGLPLAGDTSKISDPVTKEYTQRFDEVVKDNTLSFYPDYPVPGFLDFMQNNMSAMSNGNETAAQYLDKLQSFYDDGKKTVDQG